MAQYANLCSGYFGSISRDEVICGLLGCESGEGRENPEGVTGEEDYILRITCHGVGGPVFYGLYGI